METDQFLATYISSLGGRDDNQITIDHVTQHAEGFQVDYSWRSKASGRYGSSSIAVGTLELMAFAWEGSQL